MIHDCAFGPVGVARNDAYIFFSDQLHLYRKSVNAQLADPIQEVILPPYTPLSKPAEMGAMMYWQDRLYYSFSDGNFFNIVSVKPDLTDSRYELLGTGGKLRKLVGASYTTGLFNPPRDAFFILTEGGLLLRYDLNPKATQVTQLATGVTDFVLREESFSSQLFFTRSTAVYAAIGQRSGLTPSTPSGGVRRISADSGASRSVYDATGQRQVTSVEADANNLYLVEQAVSCGGIFGCFLDNAAATKRQGNPAHNGNSAASWFLIDTTDVQVSNLRSQGTWLYSIRGSDVVRYDNNTPPLQIDVQADHVEVVQAVQSLNNDVSLVANKTTVVRAYAHFGVNTTGKDSWSVGAELHGFLNNSELPGSPLSPRTFAAVGNDGSLATLRPNLDKTFTFVLPDSWMQPGQLRVEFVIDPSHGIPETVGNPYGNNTVSSGNLPVTRKGSPCLVFLPLANNAYDYDPLAPNSGFNQILERAKSLMPVEDFRVFVSPSRIDKPVVHVEFHPECFIPFTFCLPVQVHITHEPFNMPTDKTWALIWTTVYNAFHSNPSGCGDTHWVGTLPAQGQGGFNGIGGARGIKISDLTDDAGPFGGIGIPSTPLDSSLVVRMDPGQGNANVPWDMFNGGHTLAHELGHNYGRFHIDQTLSGGNCGTQKPDRPWQTNPPYPFDACTIGPTDYNDPASYFGFDPIQFKVIAPDKAGDTMSYADSHWTSKAYWDALMGVVANPPPPAPPSQSPVSLQGLADGILLLNGRINTASNLVELLPAMVAPPGMLDPTFVNLSLAALQALPSAFPYRVKLIGPLDQVLSDQPLRFLAGVDSPGDTTAFFQVMAWEPATSRVQIWNGADILAEQIVSAHKPKLAIAAPHLDVAGHSLNLAWTASDDDGDGLLFTVLYSPDKGNSWDVVKAGYAGLQLSLDSDLLAGGNQALIRVLVTDGLNTTIATTAPFIIPKHAPKVVISGVNPGERIAYGEPRMLFGLGYQPEYGTLESSRLTWTLAGPTKLTGMGTKFSLTDLAPGPYKITLTALGVDNQTGASTVPFEVLPLEVADGSAPDVDGQVAEAAYAGSVRARLAVGNNHYASIQLLHANGHLHLAVSDLPLGGTALASFAFRVDAAADRSSSAKSDDRGFVISEEGIASQEVAVGGVMTETLSPANGYSAAIHQGGGAWSAEMQIDEALVGGWNHAAGVSFALTLTPKGLGRPTVYSWPDLAGASQPSSWAPAFFGTLPPQANRGPIAIAGDPQVLNLVGPAQAHLDGGGSFDPDNDPITFKWTQVGGPSVALQGGLTATPSFSVPIVTSVATLQFRLVVNDGKLNSPESLTQIQVVPTSVPDAGLSGPEQVAKANGSFCGELVGSGLPGGKWAVQASSNLVNWVTIDTNSLNYFSIISFVDEDAKHYSHRFYRALQLVRKETQVYANGFEGAVGAEWSARPVATTPAGARKFLGPFGNAGTKLSLSGIGAHDHVQISFDLYIIQSWDGNNPSVGPDRFLVKVGGGSTLLDTTFGSTVSGVYQSYPGAFGSSYPPLTGSTEHGTLGYLWGVAPADSVYHITLSFPHTSSSVAIEFSGLNLQDLTDESWGLDNVVVKAIANP
ncbi:MAG: hypothetical protein HYR88_17610 [Verrucomicrobia bacterium]|nr:hypothetical protein [Verrucomicrobiota bacterium]